MDAIDRLYEALCGEAKRLNRRLSPEEWKAVARQEWAKGGAIFLPLSIRETLILLY